MLEHTASIFAGNSRPTEPPIDLKVHAKIGERALKNDCLEGALNKAGLLSAK